MALYLKSVTGLQIVKGEDFFYDLWITNNVQVVTVTAPTGGTTGWWKGSFSNSTTVPIDIGAAASKVEAAFSALRTIGAGNLAVTGSAGGPWTFTWQGALSTTIQPLISLNWTFSQPDASVAVGYQPRDLTGYTAACKLSDVPPGTTNYASITTTSGTAGQVLVPVSTDGHVQIFINNATTSGTGFTFTTAQMDLIGTAPSGGGSYKEAWLTATCTLLQTVV